MVISDATTIAILAFGAAVSFSAWLVLVNKRWIVLVPEFVSRIPSSSLSVFIAFALIATGVAQKQGGTNGAPSKARYS